MGLFDFLSSKKKEESRSDIVRQEMMRIHFPCGEEEINEGIDVLERYFNGRMSRNSCRNLLINAKFFRSSSQFKSTEMMVGVITEAAKLGKVQVSNAMALEILEMLGTPAEMYSGGNGATPGMAVAIGAPSGFSCVVSQYAYLQDKYGERDTGWKLIERQSNVDSRTGKHLECWKIRKRDGDELTMWFDITHSYGKI